jgi:hypothetical protein
MPCWYVPFMTLAFLSGFVNVLRTRSLRTISKIVVASDSCFIKLRFPEEDADSRSWAGLDCDSSDCAIYECNKYPLLRGCGGGLELRSLNVERDGQTVIAEQQCSLVCNNDRCLYIPTQEEEKPNSLEDLKANYRYPCALICGNKRGRCLCARKNTIAIVKKEKRADKIERGHSCPLICDQHGKCGCSKENTPAIVEKEKRAVETDLTHPCLLLCDKNGHCACAKESLSVDTTMKRDPAWIRPCSPICDKNGRCSCAEDSFPVDKTAKRDTATIHPCSLACDKNGHCDCAKEWPSVDKTGERDTEGETGI